MEVQYDDDFKPRHQISGDLIERINNYEKLPGGYLDMVDMENLSDAELLYNLRLRYT